MDHFMILGGERVPTPFECLNWQNAPDKVKRHTKVYKRTNACRMIYIHTVHGRLCRALAPGGKPSTRDLSWARSHWNSPRGASTDAYIDTDGSAAWAADPKTDVTWGAGHVNLNAMHIEIVTDEDGQMYQASLDTLGWMVETCCRRLGIQMQTPWDLIADEPYAGRIQLVDPAEGGRRCVGVLGHRNVWTYQKITDPVTGKKVADKTKPLVPMRGFGDPNSWPFLHLVEKHGFEKLAFHAPGPVVPEILPLTPEGSREWLRQSQKEPQVIAIWRERQRKLCMHISKEGEKAIDGVPLAQTVARLKDQGHDDGMWVKWNPAPKKSYTRPDENAPMVMTETWKSGIVGGP